MKSQENAINKAKSLYNKHREKLLYLFFGGMTTIISIVSKLMLFYVIPNEPAWENIFVITLSWIISVEFAFIVNKKFVFQKETNDAKSYFKLMFKFFSARLSTLGLEQLIFLIFCNLLNINQTIITLASQVIIFVSNYLLSKLLVFKKDGCDK